MTSRLLSDRGLLGSSLPSHIRVICRRHKSAKVLQVAYPYPANHLLRDWYLSQIKYVSIFVWLECHTNAARKFVLLRKLSHATTQYSFLSKTQAHCLNANECFFLLSDLEISS